MGRSWQRCHNCITLIEQDKIYATQDVAIVQNLETGCCNYDGGVVCYNNNKCEVPTTDMTNKCPDACLPGSCDWWTMAKCAATIARCAAACIERMGAGNYLIRWLILKIHERIG